MLSYVSKAEPTPEALDLITISKMQCATGLAHMEVNFYVAFTLVV